MKIKVIFSLLVVFILFNTYAKAQYYDSGQDPSEIKWKQINTDNYQLVFPEDFENKAVYIAKALDFACLYAVKSLNYRPSKISIIIHSKSTESNGMVSWAPSKMELYPCNPAQSFTDWIAELTIHEYRHVVQIDKLNQGLTRIIYYLTGEQGTAAILGLFIPQWFLEGDAVVAESVFTGMGRGRQPSFNMELRTQLLNGRKYSYEKAVFGSYKDFIPDHYILGYHIVANARRIYGNNVWDSVISGVARKPLEITPFSNGIKMKTGFNKVGLYDKTLDELKVKWSSQDSTIKLSGFRIANPEIYKRYDLVNYVCKQLNLKPLFNYKGAYVNYRKPVYLTENLIAVEKSGIDDIERFISLDGKNNEKELYTPGYYQKQSLSGKDSAIVWAANDFDKRWVHRTYSNIRILNCKTGIENMLTHNCRYFSPVLSPSKKMIAVIENDYNNNCTVVILDSKKGIIMDKIELGKEYVFNSPAWSNDEKKIVMVVNKGNRNGIGIISLDNNCSFELIVSYDKYEISNPVFAGKYIIFSAGYTGINNIFAADTSSKNLFQVTSSRFGAFEPAISPSGKKIAYSDYSEMGYRIAEIDFNPQKFSKPDKDRSFKLIDYITEDKEININELKSDTVNNYKTGPYKKIANLFNFHSWGPDASGSERNISDAYPVFSIMSQNLMNTAFTTVGYKTDRNWKEGTYFADFKYKGFYPVIDFLGEFGNKSENIGNNHEVKWFESSLYMKISQPINFTNDKYLNGLIPSFQLQYRNDNYKEIYHNTINFGVLTYGVYYYNFLKQSQRDLEPEYGISLDMQFKNTPFNDKVNFGNEATGVINLFFPGIIKHHSLRLNGGVQINSPDINHFSNTLNLPRGYDNIFTETIRQYSLEYRMPIAYPDINAGRIIYIKRFWSNLFYDYSYLMNKGKGSDIYSTGAELYSDMHLLNFMFPFEVGIRAIYLPKATHDNFLVQFMWNIIIN
ncbi:MAG: hypothetical protein Q8880_04515 [Bacteroidota bacterium]|nr:hypothetical protein [Bacteroidota bacterium]